MFSHISSAFLDRLQPSYVGKLLASGKSYTSFLAIIDAVATIRRTYFCQPILTDSWQLLRSHGLPNSSNVSIKLHCVPKKHVTTFSTITLTTGVRLQQFLAWLVASLCVIERWFHFPPHLSSATTLPWEITELKK